jgi:hypothetical protein
MEQAEEARRSHEERRRLARIGRAWAGAAIGSAKCCSSGGEWRDGDDWWGKGVGEFNIGGGENWKIFWCRFFI